MSVNELLATHDSYELQEYMALDELEPDNFMVKDFWNSQIAFMPYAANAGRDAKLTLYDFSWQKHIDSFSGAMRKDNVGSFYQKMIDAGLIEKKQDGNYGYSEVGKQRLARNRN